MYKKWYFCRSEWKSCSTKCLKKIIICRFDSGTKYKCCRILVGSHKFISLLWIHDPHKIWYSLHSRYSISRNGFPRNYSCSSNFGVDSEEEFSVVSCSKFYSSSGRIKQNICECWCTLFSSIYLLHLLEHLSLAIREKIATPTYTIPTQGKLFKVNVINFRIDEANPNEGFQNTNVMCEISSVFLLSGLYFLAFSLHLSSFSSKKKKKLS